MSIELDRLADFLDMVESLEGTFTEAVGRFRGLVVNDVLDVETAIFDAQGVVSRRYQVPFGSIGVRNLSVAEVVLTNSPPQAGAYGGVGTWVIPAGAADVVCVAGDVVTFYGAVGARISFSVFSGAQPPRVGAGGAAVPPAGTYPAAASTVETDQVAGDTNPRLSRDASGKLSWGPGNAPADVALSRSGAAMLQVDGGLSIDGATGQPLRLLNGAGAGASNVGAALYSGTGAPNNANGANGDLYLRVDGGALTTIYQRRVGVWVGII